MTEKMMLYPVFALVFLTFVVGIRLLILRVQAVKNKKLKLSYFRTNSGAEAPAAITQVSQNYDNLLALPMLFYVLVTLLLVTKQATMTMLVLGWLFVLLRIGHSYIHVTYNNVIHRAKLWFGSVVVLLVMWVAFVIYIFRS